MDEEEKIFMEFIALKKRMNAIQIKHHNINGLVRNEENIKPELLFLKNKMILCFIAEKTENGEQNNISKIALGTPDITLVISLLKEIRQQEKEFTKIIDEAMGVC